MFETDTRDSMVSAALGRHAPDARQSAPGVWRFSLANGAVVPVTARLDDVWLMLDALVRPVVSKYAPWSLLALNGRLTGAAKIACSPGDGLHLRAELPVEEGGDAAAWLADACDGFKVALKWFETDRPEELAARPFPLAVGRAPDSLSEQEGVDLAALCAASGWECSPRGGGRFAVDLGLRNESWPGALECEPARGVRAWATLACGEWPGPVRDAIARLLLRACAVVRLARPAVETDGYRSEARYEVRLPSSVCGAELAHALSALSVACDLCGREARALEDERLAAAYLKTSDE